MLRAIFTSETIFINRDDYDNYVYKTESPVLWNLKIFKSTVFSPLTPTVKDNEEKVIKSQSSRLHMWHPWSRPNTPNSKPLFCFVVRG